MTVRRMATVLAVMALLMVGCGGMFDDFSDSGNDDRQLAPGYTPCGDYPDQTHGVICHPNQYCSSQNLGICREGCLSNDNCTDEQACFKEDGRDVGTCYNVTGGSGETDTSYWEEGHQGDDELDRGYTTCGDGVSETTCHPNQYCADDYWGDCELGCLSNHNCAEDQWCDKPDGEDIGTCVQQD